MAFDVETPNRFNNRISAIGISLIDSDGSIHTTETLINPECEFDPFNIALTGICPEMVATAPTFPDIWAEISPLFTKYVLVAHNASFDMCVLDKTLTAYGLQAPPMKYLCTMKLAKYALPKAENYILPTLCSFFEVPLNHHNAGSDSEACAIILKKIEDCGVDIENFISEYYSISRKHESHFLHRNENTNSHALQELNSILKAISCDEVLNEAEISFLIDWMSNHSFLRGNYPYDRIYNKLAEVLEDGVITKKEHDELVHLFQSADDPVEANALDCNCAKIDLMGKRICLSGEFDYGSKEEVSKILIKKGALVQPSVSKTTNYLVVGGQGSSAWCAGNYGSKIKKALELQTKGIEIMIVREKDFFSSIGV